MKARWTQEIEREADGGWTRWIPIEGDRYRIACCDCGLVHDLEFDRSDDALAFRAKQNMRSTAQWRRHRVKK